MEEINWMSMTFVVDEEDGNETTIAYSTKQILPRKDEYVWLQGEAKEKSKSRFGTSAFIVTDVAHHVISNNKFGYDNIVIYCNPVKE